MPALANRPRFTYTDDSAVGQDLQLTVPARPWVPQSRPVGGREMSAGRVVASWEHRRDYQLRMRIRFTWSEWPDIRKLLEHGQRGTTITVYPDRDGAASRACILIEPDMSMPIQPRRAEGYPGRWEIDVLWTDTTDAGWEAFDFYAGGF